MDTVRSVTPTKSIADFVLCLSEAITARDSTRMPESDRVDGHLVYRVEKAALNRMEELAEKVAKPLNLVVVTQRRDEGLRVAAFSLTDDKNGRNWVLADLQTSDNPLFTPPPPREAPVMSAWRVARDIPYEEPAFFTILGPEGVGKTTLCNNLIRVFSGYPMPFHQFHHTAEWKGGSMADPAMRTARTIKDKDNEHISATTVSPRSLRSGSFRSILRAVLPGVVRKQVGSFLAELNYMKQVSSILARSYYASELVVSDRYCYDRLVRWKNLKKPLGQRLASNLVCRTMRRPFHAFVLFDDPERIHARKQIMPCWEIERHQSMLISTCEKFRVSFEVVRVTEMNEDRLAEFVSRRILTLAGPRLFAIIDAGFATISRAAVSSPLESQ